MNGKNYWTKVQVYRNLNKTREDGGKVYSVRSRKSGLVVGHESYITLDNCVLRVGEKGKQRVRDEKRKNVHAYIQGELSQLGPKAWAYGGKPTVEIDYNPYRCDSFVRVDTGESVHEAKAVFFNPFKVVAIL